MTIILSSTAFDTLTTKSVYPASNAKPLSTNALPPTTTGTRYTNAPVASMLVLTPSSKSKKFYVKHTSAPSPSSITATLSTFSSLSKLKTSTNLKETLLRSEVFTPIAPLSAGPCKAPFTSTTINSPSFSLSHFWSTPIGKPGGRNTFPFLLANLESAKIFWGSKFPV